MNVAASDSTFVVNSEHFATLKTILSYQYIDTICLIAIFLGIGIVFIGYRYSGGYENRKKIIFSISVSCLLGVLVLPLLVKGALALHVLDSIFTWAVMLLVDIVFVSFVAVHAYEMVTITAEEANARRAN